MVDKSTDCPVDLIFVLDESTSVNNENFDLMKSFLSHLVGRLDVDSCHTRVGLVCFSSDVDTEEAFNLNAHSSSASVQSAISSLTLWASLTRPKHFAMFEKPCWLQQLAIALIVRFTMYFRWEFMEICKPIHFCKAYNARSPKNNVYICAASLDPGCHGNENLEISTQN